MQSSPNAKVRKYGKILLDALLFTDVALIEFENMFIHPSIYLSMYLSIYLSIHLSNSIYLCPCTLIGGCIGTGFLSSDLAGRQHPKLCFFGDDWVIIGMTNPNMTNPKLSCPGPHIPEQIKISFWSCTSNENGLVLFVEGTLSKTVDGQQNGL